MHPSEFGAQSAKIFFTRYEIFAHGVTQSSDAGGGYVEASLDKSSFFTLVLMAGFHID